MTTRAMRGTGLFLLALLIGACTRVGHIQRNDPVRTITFPGAHTVVAQCAQQRLGAMVQPDGLDRLVIYNSAKGRQNTGFTHYSVTLGRAGEKGGFAEMRVVLSAATPGPLGGTVPLSESAVNEYWKTVQDCAALAKPAA